MLPIPHLAMLEDAIHGAETAIGRSAHISFTWA